MKAILDKNTIGISDLAIPADGIISDVAVLRDIRLSYITDSEGKRTDTVECIRYDCIDPNTYSSFTLKVQSTRPIITKEALEKSDVPVFIAIPVKEIVIKPYKIEYGRAYVSITAPYIKLAEN